MKKLFLFLFLTAGLLAQKTPVNNAAISGTSTQNGTLTVVNGGTLEILSGSTIKADAGSTVTGFGGGGGGNVNANSTLNFTLNAGATNVTWNAGNITVGNIVGVSLDGNASHVLYGNGTFSTVSGGGGNVTANSTLAFTLNGGATNVTIGGNGTLPLLGASNTFTGVNAFTNSSNTAFSGNVEIDKAQSLVFYDFLGSQYSRLVGEAGNSTIDLPVGNTFLAGLSINETFTGANTFNGATTFNTAPTGPNVTINATNTQLVNVATMVAQGYATGAGSWGTNGTSIYNLNNSGAGNVGIGINNPVSPLEVFANTVNWYDPIYMAKTAAATQLAYGEVVNDSGNTVVFGVGGSSLSSSTAEYGNNLAFLRASNKLMISAVGGSNSIVISPGSDSLSGVTASFFSSGNILLGNSSTSDPGYGLEVPGTSNFGGQLNFGTASGTQVTATTANFTNVNLSGNLAVPGNLSIGGSNVSTMPLLINGEPSGGNWYDITMLINGTSPTRVSQMGLASANGAAIYMGVTSNNTASVSFDPNNVGYILSTTLVLESGNLIGFAPNGFSNNTGLAANLKGAMFQSGNLILGNSSTTDPNYGLYEVNASYFNGATTFASGVNINNSINLTAASQKTPPSLLDSRGTYFTRGSLISDSANLGTNISLANATSMQLSQGTYASPVNSSGAMIGLTSIEKNNAVASPANGQPMLRVTQFNEGGGSAQTNGIWSESFSNGTTHGDLDSVVCVAGMLPGSQGNGESFFAYSYNQSSDPNAIVETEEIWVQNASGNNNTFNGTATYQSSTDLALINPGNLVASSAIFIAGSNQAGGTNEPFDVGIGFSSFGNGAASTADIRTYDSSTYALEINGTHSGGAILTASGAGTIKSVDGFNTSAGTLTISGGYRGTFTLVAGAATISNANVTASSVIIITMHTPGGTIGLYEPMVATKTAGTGFTVATLATDTSTYDYVIIN